MRRVAIQGEPGCFHEAAARNYFKGEEIETVSCDSFPVLFETLEKEKDYLGIVAIENTIAGALLQNHELLRSSELQIIGEYKLRVSHVLTALEGETMESIREVQSHPIALMQCVDFLNKYPHIKVVEADDTAGSAKNIAENNLKGTAAVCGELAANLYGLNILHKSIETNKRNFTRFLILSDINKVDENAKRATVDKASIVFSLPHTHGSLAKILTIFSFYDINMTKIQSMPIIGCEWEYRFYIDVTFDDYVRYRQSLTAITPLTKALKVLGEYKAFTQDID